MTGMHWSDDGAPPETSPDQPTLRIEQSELKQVGGVAFASLGGLAFLIVAVAVAGESPMALVVFGFFGIFMLLGGLVALRRGSDRRLIEVGPDGMWLPEMGRLAWSDIREVRLEVVRGVGGGGDAVVPYRRLGVVPMDPDLKPAAPSRLAWAMFDGYARLVKSLAPGSRFGAEDRAPFGLGQPEATSAEVDAALGIVGRYVEVIDAGQERARSRAPRWAAREAAVGRNARPDPSRNELRAIDARLATGETGATVETGTAASGSFVRASPGVPPSATFRVPALSPRVVSGWLWGLIPIAGFLVFVLVGLAGQLQGFTLLVLLILVGFLGPIVARFGPRAIETVRRSRMSEADRIVLRIGPDGIWLPGIGGVPWDRIRAVRARTSGSTPVGIGASIPRWGLFVEPEPGAAPVGERAVYADQLDVPFDDVVDLVRYYHPVDEIG